MAPRFQKQRQNPPSSPAATSFQYDNRWQSSARKSDEKERDDERKDYRRQGSDDSSYKASSSHRSYSGSEHEEKRGEKKIPDHDDWHRERPQRPDSRDSRVSRDSRQSEPRDYGSWADAPFESAYEEKKKEPVVHRGQVPGPITKERIEADDLMKSYEKRNLTQLKRGQLPDKKISETKKDEKAIDDSWNIKKQPSDSSISSKSWNEPTTTTSTTPQSESQKLFDAIEKPLKNYATGGETETKIDEEEKKTTAVKEKRAPPSRNRSDRSSQWGGSSYSSHRTFSRRGGGGGQGGRTGRNTGGPPRAKAGDGGIGTDSEGSLEELDVKVKKTEKDERNKEIRGDKSPLAERKNEKQQRDGYVPRGEPSRLGRGGYSVRRGGMGKKIDGYGPPPLKSPFGNAEEKKANADENIESARKDKKLDDRNRNNRKPNDTRRGKTNRNDEGYSDNSEDGGRKWSGRSGQSNRRNQPLSREKRNIDLQQKSDEKTSESDVKKDEDSVEGGDFDEKQPDSDGFQEVKAKKTGKEKLKDEKPSPATKTITNNNKPDLNLKSKPTKPNNGNNNTSQLTQQQISNIPPLMATPINPPAVLPQPTSKGRFDRLRQNVLPPRLMKQKENNRLQKAQMQHQQNLCEGGDLKVGGGGASSMGMYGMKDATSTSSAVGGMSSNAWDKPLTGQLRGGLEPEVVMSVGGMENCKGLEQQVQSPGQSQSPNAEKVSSKLLRSGEKKTPLF